MELSDLKIPRQIMSLSNSLMYEGRLECGSERTASALLTLPFLTSVQSELRSYSDSHPQHELDWIQSTLLPSNPVCFLDCSKVGGLFINELNGILSPCYLLVFLFIFLIFENSNSVFIFLSLARLLSGACTGVSGTGRSQQSHWSCYHSQAAFTAH